MVKTESETLVELTKNDIQNLIDRLPDQTDDFCCWLLRINRRAYWNIMNEIKEENIIIPMGLFESDEYEVKFNTKCAYSLGWNTFYKYYDYR